MAVAIQQLNARLQQQETAGDDTHTRERKTRTASAEHDRARQDSACGQEWSTRVIGKPDQFDGLVVQTEVVPRSRGPAVISNSEEESALSTQMCYIDCRSRVGQVSQCRRERGVRETGGSS